MKRLFGAWTWHYSFGHDPEIDFCLWVLERDGLLVPPFDRHGAGDGSSRAAGLDAAGWWTWFARVVAVSAEHHRNRFKRDWLSQPPPRPADLWRESSAVGHRLRSLAAEFDEIWDERAASKNKMDLAQVFQECEPPLWKQLLPYRRKLPPVRVVTVGYLGPVQTAIWPDTIILAVANWQPEPGELAAAILDGMRSLAGG